MNSTRDAVSRARIKAAEYLRTSTELQPHSIESQRRSIREYADRHGFEIIRTYVDHARSGLTLAGRPGLSALLSDIAYGRCQYRAVLVYDVSRWGRFQDTDEGAHYEFLCKAMNAPVRYCAESFASDIELPALILKNLKRTIAAEYSRELSAKCFRGQKQLSKMGFRTGGTSGYGLRRMAVSADGSRTVILREGELKSISTDRIVLVPGPENEVEVVRWIFSKAADTDASCAAIAAELNQRGVPYKPECKWEKFVVDSILHNEKYAGCHVWNRSTGQLGTTRRSNPASEWIVVPDAFQPIVSRSQYEKAQRPHRKARRWTNEQLVQRLEQVKSGSAEECGPSLATLRRRLFGISFLRSARGTRPINVVTGVPDTRQRILALRNQILDELLELFRAKILEFHQPGKSRPILKLADGRMVSVIVCARLFRKTGIMRWMLRPVLSESDLITLICLEASRRIRYFLVPRVTLCRQTMICTNHRLLKTGIRLNDLTEFYDGVAAFASSSPRGGNA